MDKLKLAHDYFMGMISRPSVTLREENLHNIRHNAWEYADAMQAEAEKRVNKERPDVLCEVDWSQAPEWANWWVMDVDSAASWLSDHPSSDPLKIKVWTAPSFDYQGNWQNSLRKRPQ